MPPGTVVTPLDVPLVQDETVKPTATGYPLLLPTLKTMAGLVLHGGAPAVRNHYLPAGNEEDLHEICQRTTALRELCTTADAAPDYQQIERFEPNLQACAFPTSKQHLLDYIRHRKRIDIEQAVAMVIAYLNQSVPHQDALPAEQVDDFEKTDVSSIRELMIDQGVVGMLGKTCMWREAADFEFDKDIPTTTRLARKGKILQLLGRDEEASELSDPEFVTILQHIRRKRRECNNSHHLTMPTDILPEDEEQRRQWSPDNSYRRTTQEVILDEHAEVVSKRKFRLIYQNLAALQPSTSVTSLYVRDVQTFISNHDAFSPRRIDALEISNDPFAIAYGFIAAQRNLQRRVVSNRERTRVLAKVEEARLLQNRPDVLTSFEDILVRHASDLRALTAIKCPQGIRDHFSTPKDVKDRARGICELMERYVHDFGAGKMDNLRRVVVPIQGNYRGPIDFYNALCDELTDCEARAQAAGIDLRVGPVQKFPGDHIKSWYNSGGVDAFEEGKPPGWVEFLTRVRAQEINLS